MIFWPLILLSYFILTIFIVIRFGWQSVVIVNLIGAFFTWLVFFINTFNDQ